mgnify:CR=1 FL=1
MKNVAALLSGLVFGLGLTLSGMSDTTKALGFLDIAGAWIPDLAFVMGGALLITIISTPLILKRSAPLIAAQFSLPTKQALDRQLITGALIFCIGWGLSGYCPGPGLVSLLYGYESTLVFCLAMLVGMRLEHRFSAGR